MYSTIVKDEDKYICQWIDYHYTQGVNRFIIYDNSDKNTLEPLLRKYNDIIVLIKWPYPYILEKSGISGQTTQQNHSIHAFQTSKYIGLFDIDEYLNIQSDKKLDIFLDEIQKNIDISKISGFRILNKFFYNPDNLPEENFLHMFECDNISYSSNEKNIVIPKNVKTISVHTITSGLPICTIDPSLVFFNHYCFLNKVARDKIERGRKKTNMQDNSILIHL